MNPELQAACRNGDVEELKRILVEDPEQLKRVNPGTLDSTLHVASEFGHDDLVKEILNMKPEMVKAVNLRKETPLHKAAAKGFLSVVKVLLDANTSMADRLDCEDCSAFFVACEGGHLEVVEELKNKSKSSTVEKLDCRGHSGLFVASQYGHVGAVRYLLNQTRLLQLEKAGRRLTSLHIAAFKGHGDVVRAIIKVCPEMAWRSDSAGYLPIHLASREGHVQATRELLTIHPELCFKPTADEKLTPLHIAAIGGHVGVMEEILTANVDSAKVTTEQGETLLHLCVKNHQYQAIRSLLAKLPSVGDLVNERDCNGNTILHLASLEMSFQIVRYLVKDARVDINARNNDGLTALDVAKETEATITISELEKAGARENLPNMMDKFNHSNSETKVRLPPSSEPEMTLDGKSTPQWKALESDGDTELVESDKCLNTVQSGLHMRRSIFGTLQRLNYGFYTSLIFVQ